MFELLLLATICLNIGCDVLDRRVSSRSDVRAMTLWTSILQLLLVSPLIFRLSLPSPGQLLVLLVLGIVSSYAREKWYRALSHSDEELSRFVPFVRLSGVMVLVLAVLVLGERPSAVMAVGAVLMIGAGILIGFERPGAGLGAFLHNNRALALVLVFATSNALISVGYKHLLGQGLGIISVYFYLKLFQCLPLVARASFERTLLSGHREIVRRRLFLAARVMQTSAALLFLIVLSKRRLVWVEPMMAVSPFLVLAWEWVERRLSFFHPAPRAILAPGGRRRALLLRISATLATVTGFLLVHLKG